MNLTRDQIESISRRAKALARKEGYGHLADDFAQEVLLATATGRRAGLLLLFVDFLRAEYGRTGSYSSPGGRAKSAGRLRSASLVDEEGEEVCAGEFDHPGPDALIRSADAERLARTARAHLTSAQLQVYSLVFEEGLSQLEVADVVGVTESRISQIVSRIERVLADALIPDQFRDAVQAGDLSLEVEVQWLAI